MEPFLEGVREASKFFMKKDDVHETLVRVARRLEEEGIDYALIGGMALFAHGFRRLTTDVDILTTPAGHAAIHERLVGRGFDATNGVTVQFITSDESRHRSRSTASESSLSRS